MELVRTRIKITCSFHGDVIYNKVYGFNYGNTGYYWLCKILKENETNLRETMDTNISIRVTVTDGDKLMPIPNPEVSVSKSVRDFANPICDKMNKVVYVGVEEKLKKALRKAQKKLVVHQGLRKEYLSG